MASAFFFPAVPLLFLNLYTVGQACDGHADNLCVSQGLFLSCDALFPSVPLFTDLCLQLLRTGISASN